MTFVERNPCVLGRAGGQDQERQPDNHPMLSAFNYLLEGRYGWSGSSPEVAIQRTGNIESLNELKSMSKINSSGQFLGHLQQSQNRSWRSLLKMAWVVIIVWLLVHCLIPVHPALREVPWRARASSPICHCLGVQDKVWYMLCFLINKQNSLVWKILVLD
jgi:hypothetical protein